MEKHVPVGYLKPRRGGYEVICPQCDKVIRDEALASGERAVAYTPIYKENIYPYRQRCSGCGETIVKGQSTAWPELYAPGKAPATPARHGGKPRARRAALGAPASSNLATLTAAIRKLTR